PEKDWFSLATLGGQGAQLPYDEPRIQKLAQAMKGLIAGFMGSDAKAWNESVYQFTTVLRNDLSKGNYPSTSVISREIHYNELRPFRWAWIFYAFAFVALMAFHVTNKNWAK